MSGRVLYAVQCDVPDCTNIDDSAEDNLSLAREEAALRGWRHRLWTSEHRSGPAPSLDFCPEHAELADEPSPPFRRKPAR